MKALRLGRSYMVKASDLFVAALENEGVDRIFGIPGEENLDVVDSIRKSSIQLIITRHEQAAAFMAATYGRQARRLHRNARAGRAEFLGAARGFYICRSPILRSPAAMVAPPILPTSLDHRRKSADLSITSSTHSCSTKHLGFV